MKELKENGKYLVRRLIGFDMNELMEMNVQQILKKTYKIFWIQKNNYMWITKEDFHRKY